MSDHPTPKLIKTLTSEIEVTVDREGWPHWVRINDRENGLEISFGHEEARDMLYAMQRIVAFLDRVTKDQP